MTRAKPAGLLSADDAQTFRIEPVTYHGVESCGQNRGNVARNGSFFAPLAVGRRPASASCSSHAAMSPCRSDPSTITSPRLTPMRTSMRWSSGSPAFRSAIPRWISTAHSTASTTLTNSARRPSPIRLKIVPRCAAIAGSRSSVRRVLALEGSRLVQLHQAAVTSDVRGEDGGELAFHERAPSALHEYVNSV